MKLIDIGGRMVGPGEPCFIIAEAGINHNGDLGLAKELVDAAKDSGADAVKFQTFIAEEVISPQAPKADYQIDSRNPNETQLDMARRLELPFSSFRRLRAYCEKVGIQFMSSPFDGKSVDFLMDLDVPAFKVPSGEITNIPLLEQIASKKKPMIVSTGMSNLGEVEAAISAIGESGDPDVILLHCVSSYPAEPAEVNLRAMNTLAQAFNVPVGFSDHTLGLEVPLAAVALGACTIEKHFTLDRTLTGPDHAASLEPEGLTQLIRSVRKVESSMGDGRKTPATSELNTVLAARRSLVAARDLSAGTMLTEGMIAVMRPGSGLSPELLPYLLHRTIRTDIRAGQPITWEMLS